MHLFYRINRVRWAELDAAASAESRTKLEALCAANANSSHPRLTSYANVGGKADLALMLQAAELGQLAQMHRDVEACFAPGVLDPVFSYFSVTELSEYMPSEEESRQTLLQQEKLAEESEEFKTRMAESNKRRADYEHYRLYPELPDWEVMGFYPMSKRRLAADNWYMLDFATRKRLMGGHARVGRKFAGRVSQLITGSTGLDGWEWGVTLMAHQVDALKEIVYEMRFDEVTARYGEFGPFYINLRLAPAALWEHLRL
ncbi:MAG: Chlorite dismutase [Pedosphaera sp.]|nr:Chlorite dismutase [Pedosphaera sp.]